MVRPQAASKPIRNLANSTMPRGSVLSVVILTSAAIAVRLAGVRGADLPTDNQRKRIVGRGVYTPKDEAWEDVIRFAHYPAGKPVTEYLKFVDQNPTSELADEALLMAVDVAAAGKRYRQAHELLDRVMAEYPKSAHTIPLWCFSLPGRGMVWEGETKLESHLRDHPNFSADLALLLKARLLRSESRTSDAVKLLTVYVERLPQGRWALEDTELRENLTSSWPCLHRVDEEIFLELAQMHFEQRQEASAIKVLESAIPVFRLSPLQPAYFDLLAKSYQRAGDTPKERQTLQELLTLLRQKKVTHATGGGKQVVIRIIGMPSIAALGRWRNAGTRWVPGASWQGFTMAICTTQMPTVEQVEERLRKLK